ncbi:LysM peptidoglycan-binding domain-containing protein [uncultured Granulicatella sp.]|uniref:muramidase family protein n=1 Tax=uncultured Granulicatella sp. TaxID=316089 RepID=UPI0028DB6A39|nr:LysM peptidoglycan-binding domain-containing protein [uncultured Granulicatella sp.]
MLESRNARLLRIKKEKQSQKVQMMNQSLKRSLIVVGTTACVGLYVSPVDQLLSVNFSVVEASTAATQFLRNIIPAAQNVARGKDIYASVMIAQAALESGWGTSALSKAPNHNLFGVKGSYNGQSVNMQTLEDSGGQNYYSIQADFRKYPSYQESLEDYADKIVNGISGAPLFYSGAWKSKTNSYQDATAYLTGRYATDTAYGAKLNRIIEQFGLTKYDTETAVNMAEEIASNETSTTSGNSYTVVSGDSLYAIARKTGTSIQDLLSLNGLNLNSIIHPGQVLALSSKSATTETKQEESVSKEEKANEETTNEETSTSTKRSSSSGTYTVVSGDGLYAIARKTGTSIDDLLSLNGLSLTSTIYPGQVLTLSANSQEAESEESSSTENESSTSTQETSSEENAASSEQTSTGGTYTVVSGDGLYAIARKTGTSIDDLLSLNGLSLNSTIYPGQVLTLSGNSEAAPAAESTESTAEESQEEVATPEETTPSTNAKMYYVHSGDSLYRIAHNHGISLSTLLEWNNLSVDSIIYPGQGLIVSDGSSPSSEQAEESTSSSEETASESTETTYTVQPGDGLWRIAKNHGLTLDELKSLNQLTSNIIQPGQVLIVSK